MHSHDHTHDAHGHHHAPAHYGRAFQLGVTLNVAFIAVEIFFGFYAHSLALLADAGHNATDVLGLLLAWGALVLAERQPTVRLTFGLRGASIIAALANGVLVFGVAGGIIWEAFARFAAPAPVGGTVVMAVAAVGIAVNGLTALLFFKGSHHDLNVKGAYLHMLADAGVSAGVVVSGALMAATGLQWLDPAVSLAIGAVIIAGSWGLMRDSIHLSLHGVPAQIDPEAVKDFLAAQDGVSDVHDLHIWAMSTNQNALSAHLVMPAGHPGDAFYVRVAHELEDRFAIHHTTLQIETGTAPCACPLDHDHPHD